MTHALPTVSTRRRALDAALHSGSARADALPAGAVTFLYTDIEGSTERWERAPAAMRLALTRHHALLRAAILAHGGVVYQIVGDAFVAVFAHAPDALLAALQAQRDLQAETWDPAIAPIRVRMGLYYGQGRYLDDGYHAEESLSRLFRLLSAAYGGQIVLTAELHGMLADRYPPGVSARDLGLHRLRDLTTRLHVWQLLAPGLPADFPPLRSLSHHPNNLPAQPTELFGRAEAIAAAAARLRAPHTRLLTLVGLGGVGKTRLGLAVAAELLPDFPDGVFLVALDQAQSPAQVAPALAATLGLRDAGEQPLAAQLAQHLQPKRLLLLIDNCEHVLCAMPLLADLLRAAPHLRILTTSRAALGIYGEQEQAVPPLALPAASAAGDLPALSQNPAVQLFVARAQAVAPGFELSAANAAAVAEICVRLEGLPLALELAGARARALPPKQLLERLNDRLNFLAAQSRAGPGRQQTLRATLEWSYGLLAPQEQRLLAWLSVFAGGASLEALTAVWQCDEAQPLDVVDGLLALISHSLVQPSLGGESPRYVLLETVREYGCEQLVARGELEAARLRHGAYFRQVAEVYGGHRTLNDPAAKAALTEDYPNLRAALVDALERPDTAMALEIGKNLTRLWWSNGFVREGCRLLQAALALPLPLGAPGDLRLRRGQAQLEGVMLAEELGEHALARTWTEAALDTARALGDEYLLASSLAALSDFLDPAIDYAQICGMLNESLALHRRLGQPSGLATIYIKLGVLESMRKAHAAAQGYYEAALELFRESGNRRGMLAALSNLGLIAEMQHRSVAAEQYYDEALALSYALDLESKIIGNLLSLGSLALRQLDQEKARTRFCEALQRADQGGYTVLAIFAVGHIAALAQAGGRLKAAARLLGAYEQLAASHRVGQNILIGYEEALMLEARQQALARLGADAFAQHHAAGRRMALPEAIAAAQRAAGRPCPSSPTP